MITYRIKEEQNRGILLATYYNGRYIGDSFGYWIGRDTLMTYPKRIYSAPPAGTELKRRVSLSEVSR